jgi:bacillolysin
MSSPFMSVRYHVGGKTNEELASVTDQPRVVRSVAPAGDIPTPKTQFDDDEAAARFYVGKVMEQDSRPAVRGLTAPDRPEVVPDMRLKAKQHQPLTKTRLVTFEQTKLSVPIFGSQVVVELDADQQLVSVDAEVARIKEVSAIASITPEEALDKIAKLTGAKLDADELGLEAPRLMFFHDDKKKDWHLAWFFQKVPAAPKKFLQESVGTTQKRHGLGRSPRELTPLLNYLVDAHNGKVLFYYSATPLLDVPSGCKGTDELGAAQDFYGRQVPTGFEMTDPFRGIKTYDLKRKDLQATASFPKNAIRSKAANLQSTNTAAVSAHVNATKVYDFYKSVLMRDSIDGKGMVLESVVNCTYAADEPPPEWHNAVWYNNRMWYGQYKDGNGKMRSFSRYLDVIAHELTHGVTEHTANLVYNGQSGALNESFSDIFGIIISNWDPTRPNADATGWKWEIGAGLGANGLPLRDMSNPGRTGDPDHMKNYLETTKDSGGVHTNSNIHNKAAHNVLSAVDANNKPVFTARDVAVLYYLCLSRLNSLADFAKTLETLVGVAGTYYGGDAAVRDQKIKAIRDAYKRVGIP